MRNKHRILFDPHLFIIYNSELLSCFLAENHEKYYAALTNTSVVKLKGRYHAICFEQMGIHWLGHTFAFNMRSELSVFTFKKSFIFGQWIKVGLTEGILKH